jgi:hypothetical protein
MTVAPGGRPPLPIRLRQSRPEPGNLIGIVTWAVLAYTFAGFGVFWLLTGSTRIGEVGTWTTVGGIVWIGPIFAWFVVWLVGPRGWLRHLWARPVRITIDRDGLAWTLANRSAGACRWADLGGVSSGVDHRVRWRAVFHRDGSELFTFAAPLVDETTGRRVQLPELISQLRPDLFEPLDPRHPERACVRRTAPVLASVSERLSLDPAP